MTFTEIVTEITNRLNLTSTAASTRIGLEVNRYYKRVTTALNLKTSRQGTVTQAMVAASREVTFSGVEKIDRIIDNSASAWTVLTQITYDEMRDTKATTSAPTKWAIKTVTGTTVIVMFDCAAPDTRVLTADGQLVGSTLSGSNVPAFPESFHDVLVEGVLQDEYKKQEKTDLASMSKSEYEQRLSDLKMFMAKSAYLLRRQGQTPRSGRRTLPNRIG